MGSSTKEQSRIAGVNYGATATKVNGDEGQSTPALKRILLRVVQLRCERNSLTR